MTHYDTLIRGEIKEKNAKSGAKVFGKICPVCGKSFTAQKISTQFCSQKCANTSYKARKRAEKLDMAADLYNKAVSEQLRRDFAKREALSPTLAAKYLSVSRNTLYRYIHAGVVPCQNIYGTTRILKSDLSTMFSSQEPFIGEHFDVLEEDISEYVTVAKTAIKFSLTLSTAEKAIHASSLEGKRYHGVDYYRKDEIDAFFEHYNQSQHPEITSWYTCREIMKKYNMSQPAVYLMAHDNDIPSKISGRTVYYSRKHVDQIKKQAEDSQASTSYYSVPSVMEEYGMTEDQVLRTLRKYNIKKDKIGCVIRFRKDEFDRIFEAQAFDE